MRVTKFESSPARRILTAMIGNDAVCGKIASLADEDLFSQRAENIIGNLCVDHFNRYGKSPKKDIEHVVRSWSTSAPESQVGEVDDLIQSFDLDNLDKNLNADLVIDDAAKYFDRVKMEKAVSNIQAHLAAGQVDKARALFDSHKPIQMGAGSFINPLTDDEALKRVYAEKREPLIEYPGGVGDFFGYSLEREALVAILAAEKMGKSHFLLEFAAAAVEQGKKVAMFECGDLTERQVMRRLLTRICGRPLSVPKNRDSIEFKVPVAITMEDHQIKVKHETYTIMTNLTDRKIRKYRDEWTEKYNAKDNWRLSVHSTSSLSVPGMRTILARWEKDGFNPDVVVIDYADIVLGPLTGGSESREQINATWKALSKMRQDLRCLVITATQANADAYEAELLNRRNFSEDKRKHAHVTGMFALNRSDGEKRQGVYRLNWLDRRDEPYSEREVCFVAGCLEIGQPIMLSHFVPKWRQK